jgi:hypothetical protein
MQMNAPPLAARECVAPVPLGDTVPAEDAALSASLKEPTNGPGGAVVVRTLRISDILRDSRLQVREGLDEGTIRRYADGMKAGVEFTTRRVGSWGKGWPCRPISSGPTAMGRSVYGQQWGGPRSSPSSRTAGRGRAWPLIGP